MVDSGCVPWTIFVVVGDRGQRLCCKRCHNFRWVSPKKSPDQPECSWYIHASYNARFKTFHLRILGCQILPAPRATIPASSMLPSSTALLFMTLTPSFSPSIFSRIFALFLPLFNVSSTSSTDSSSFLNGGLVKRMASDSTCFCTRGLVI